MHTYDDIIDEIKSVPVDKLDDLFQFIQTLTPASKEIENLDKYNNILSFAGIFSDMSEHDYIDFVEETKKTRDHNFSRTFSL